MPDLQFPYVPGQEDPTLGIIKKLLGLGQPSQQPTGFMGKLKMALPGMIQGGIDAASTPNIGMGGPIDIFRSLQTSQALKRSRDLSDRASNGQRVDDLLKYIDYQRRAKLDEERQRHDMATEDAITRTNQRLLDQNSETAQNQYLTGLSGFLKTGGQMRPKTTPLAPAPLPTGNVDAPSVDQLPTPQMMPSRSPSLSAQDTLAPGEMIVPGSTRDPADQVRVGLTPAEEARRLEEAKHADWPTVSPELAAKVPHFGVQAGQKVDPQTLREMQQAANALVLQENKPDARLPGSEQLVSDADIAAANAMWNPHLKSMPKDQFRKGMNRAEFNQRHSDIVAAVSAATREANAGKGDVNALDRETARFAKPHEKYLADSETQIQKIDDAVAELQGAKGTDAVTAALAVPKILTALVSGQGTGVRITQPEQERILKSRGIVGNIQAFFSKIRGQGDLTAEQRQQFTQVLLDTKNRLAQKRLLHRAAADKINSAPSRDEILAADREANQALDAYEKSTAAGGAATSGAAGPTATHRYDPAIGKAVPVR